MQQYKEVCDRNIAVLDTDGKVIACTVSRDVGKVYDINDLPKPQNNGIIYHDNYLLQNIFSETGKYMVLVSGNDIIAENYINLLSVSLRNLKQFYDDKYDRTSFIKNVIFDNVLPSDIYAKSRDLEFAYEKSRYVMIVHCEDKSGELISDIVAKSIGDALGKYVININENEVAVVVDASEDTTMEDANEYANSLVKQIQSNGVSKCFIGLGSIAQNLRELSRSHKDAQLSLEIGNVFNRGSEVLSYDNLGIGRLIFQMPTTLCDIFISEVFKQGSIESLDEEALATIEKFFENNLNVSETARKLFVHRNTLVYRLEKIKKSTGLDIREFDNAIIFKVALMVNNYLANNKKY